jgi:2-dehydropantoate 2-reductase
MNDIKKIAILGAGAMGAFFTAKFIETHGVSTAVVARDQRYERLKNHGLMVNGTSYMVPVIHPDEDTAHADLIIVALKHHHLPEAVPDLKNLVGDSTLIISVMNGLDSEKYIGSMYGMDKMLYAISVGIDAVRQGNNVIYTNPGKHLFGEEKNPTVSERVERVQNAFSRAGIPFETPEDMIRTMWWKFMVNVGMNQTSAVMRIPYGVFQTSSEAQALMEALMREVIVLAQSVGVDLTERDLDEWYNVLKTMSPDGKTSMLQDIEEKRKTEIEIFGQKVVDLGNAHGVPTPVNQTVLTIIRVLEKYPA